MDKTPNIKGDEVRHGKSIYLDALSTEVINTLSETSLSEFMLYQLNDGRTPFFPMTAKQMAQRTKSIGELVFAIRLRTDETCIGVCSLSDIRWQARHAKLQVHLLDESHFTMEILADVLQTTLQFTYWEANLNRIAMSSIEDNTVLHEALAQVGFTIEGRLRQEVYRNGNYHDVLIYSILQREWADLHSN